MPHSSRLTVYILQQSLVPSSPACMARPLPKHGLLLDMQLKRARGERNCLIAMAPKSARQALGPRRQAGNTPPESDALITDTAVEKAQRDWPQRGRDELQAGAPSQSNPRRTVWKARSRDDPRRAGPKATFPDGPSWSRVHKPHPLDAHSQKGPRYEII